MATAEPGVADTDTTTITTTITTTETECSVCHELFKDPKLLPCAHVLCRGCVLTWLSSSKTAHCPLCRDAITAPAHTAAGKEWETVVDALPDDVTMASLVQSQRVLSQDNQCGGCRQAVATFICLHCGDMLCASCTAAHGNLKATREHVVEDLTTMTPERLSTKQPATCGTHGDKTAELYCATHSAAICHLCASTEHRSCPRVLLFDKHVAELRADLASISKTLKAAEEALDVASRQLDQQDDEAEKVMQKSLRDIRKACDRLDKSVKECRCRLETLAQNGKATFKESVTAGKVVLSDRRRRVSSTRRVVDRVKRSSPPGLLQSATMTIKSRLSEVDLTVSLDPKVDAMETVTVDTQTLTRLEKELSFLGQRRSVPVAQSQAKAWKFLPNADVCLTNESTTAQRQKGVNAIVMSAEPMKINTLYEVQVDTVKGKSADYFPCGVVKDTEGLTIPRTALDGWKDAIVFSYMVFVNKKEMDFKIENRLQSLKQGTRVGFVLQPGGFLHLYIDGVKQWVYVSKAPATCHVFFELLHTYQKITALPLTSKRKV